METLDNLRDKIRCVDDELMKLLRERETLIIQVGKFKKTNGIKIKNKFVEDEILARCSTRFVKCVYKDLLKRSCEEQKVIVQ